MSTLSIAQANVDKYYDRLQRIFEQSKSITTGQAEDFIVRCARLEDHYNRFEEYAEKVMEFQLENQEQQENIDTVKKIFQERCKNYDEMFNSVSLVLNKCKKLIQPPPSQSVESQSRSQKYSSVKLPKIPLKQFDGSIQNWSVFYENFKSLIHDKTCLSPIEKFHYLISSLSGPALSIAKNLPLTSENYAIAWKSLVSRYQSNRTLGTHLLDAILNQPAIQSGTSTNLTNLASILDDSFESLKALKIEKLDEFILLHIALKKLPVYLRRAFESQNVKTTMPTFTNLIEFLNEQTKIATYLDAPKERSQTYQKSKVYLSNENYSAKVYTCPVCDEVHPIFNCETFKSKSFNDKMELIKQLKRCFNCLSQSHDVKDCKSKYSCRKCKSRHHTLLCPKSGHFSAPVITNERSEDQRQNTEIPKSNFASNTLTPSQSSTTHTNLLGTAIVEIEDSNGCYQTVRVLVDSCAMSNFITVECADRLNLKIQPDNTNILGLADQEVTTYGAVECCIKPRYSAEPKLRIQAIVLSKITDKLPSTEPSPDVKRFWKELDLADPQFDTANNVDILLGAEVFPYIYTGQKKITSDKGSALQSIFGWIITGKVRIPKVPCKQTSLLTVEDRSLKDILTKFWEVEEPAHIETLDPEDQESEEKFQREHYRDETGRYVVPLLLKSDAPALSDSYHLAKKRLLNMELKLQKDPKKNLAYNDFLQEYEDLGHMTQAKSHGEAEYYIPHSMVIREASISTQHRVVFDASMTTTSGVSLNNVLHTGPKLQKDLSEIILRFRTHKVAFTTDICKMFRQILIKPQDRKFQHILWRENANTPIKDFELNTVTYGTSSAPYLANRTVKQLIIDHQEQYPIASKILSEDIFVDDVISGEESVNEAISARNELTQMAGEGCFELKKWASSHPEVLDGLKESEIAQPKMYVDFDNNEELTHGVLGLRWSPKNDCFSYSKVEFNDKVTKRAILSNIGRVFDPVGWITPIVLGAKIIIQRLWISGLNWDDKVSPDIEKAWFAILNELPLLNKLQIPRLIFNPEEKKIMLVGFSDGSEVGYGAAIYVITSTVKGHKSNLLLAKSKVAPTKPLTIPRLELCGAELLTRTMNVALKSLESTKYSVERIIALTDSTTVLSWLTTPPYKLKTYVANRVVKILDSIPADSWSHVSSQDNAADVASRSTLPKDLVNNSLWWTGPQWLQKPIGDWKISSIQQVQVKDLPEIKSKTNNFLIPIATQEFSSKYSSLSTLQRTTAWCLRFYRNTKLRIAVKQGKGTEEKIVGPLTPKELDTALIKVIKIVQTEHFKSDIQALKVNKVVSNQILNLNPFIDTLGILRVGGRLTHSKLPIEAKHPAILPKKSHFTELVITHYHKLHLHAGPRLLQSIISQKYWILSARNSIRAQIHKCITCFRAAPKNQTPLMGNLPEVRIVPARCFLKVGVDFGGPYFTKESKRRNATSHKSYICLFVCMTTKALHLELVSDLTTEAFLAAFERFLSRRGLCQEVYSDSGTNFIGARNQLCEIYEHLLKNDSQAKIQSKLAEKGITWHFIPPSGPHFGGLWESGIKSVKYHLTRVIGEQNLTFEEFTTLLIRIEAILNSRPLCTQSSDPEELDAITPAHFLIGGPLLSLPQYDWSLTPENRLSRWQLLQKISQHFWKRWSLEYLNSLQQRKKWQHKTPSLKENDVVLIKDDNAAPLQWKLRRIITLHPGADNIARVASVKTKTTTLKRPVAKLFRLPIDEIPSQVAEAATPPPHPQICKRGGC